MNERRLEIEWRAGRRVTAAVTPAPPGPTSAALVLAHGAGGNLEESFLAAMAEGLATHGFSTLRFNFPYRQEGRRVPDPAPTLEECYRAVVTRASELFAPARLLLGGKSLGGRMASHLTAAGVQAPAAGAGRQHPGWRLLPRLQPASASALVWPAAAAGLVFLGYPLHPPGRPEKLRDEHLYRIRIPMLFVSGTRDAFAQQNLLEPVLERLNASTSAEALAGNIQAGAFCRDCGRPAPGAGLALATAHWVAQGDHSFRVPGRSAAEVRGEILDAVAAWVRSVLSS